MKTRKQINKQKGFTLVEMLVVIAIVGILAAILVPVVGRAMTKAKVATAKKEMADIILAIQAYRKEYSRWPTPDITLPPNEDYTFGSSASDIGVDNNYLMSILCNRKFPSSGASVVNYERKNPKKIEFLELMTNGEKDGGFPGLSEGGYYCDPFGNPYIITIDYNGDNKCEDKVYKKKEGSGDGASGLEDKGRFTKSGNPQDIFTFVGGVMVWSIGPDKKFDPNGKANEGVNADNILSWSK